MLRELLRRVDDAGTSVLLAELADELGVTTTVVRDMLTDLALRGYLRPTGGECTTQCGGCAFATSCHGEVAAQTWQLTAKGRTALGARA